jgi:hypothetical protein
VSDLAGSLSGSAGRLPCVLTPAAAAAVVLQRCSSPVPLARSAVGLRAGSGSALVPSATHPRRRRAIYPEASCEVRVYLVPGALLCAHQPIRP